MFYKNVFRIMALCMSLISCHVFAENNTQITQAYLASIQKNPNAVQMFVNKMPKGGDLHFHLLGSDYAENMLANAPQDYCISEQMVAYQGSCKKTHQARIIATTNPSLYNKVINAWSMRNFHATNQESGHDHFFNAFAKFTALGSTTRAKMIAQLANQAAREHLDYIEMMITPDNDASGMLAKSIQWTPKYSEMERRLKKAGINNILKQTNKTVNTIMAESKAILRCSTADPEPGCQVKVRFLYQVLRDNPKSEVFAQLLLGYRLTKENPFVLGVNIVQPEDGYYSLHDYTAHMKMFRYLSQQYPSVKKSLHAGELNSTLVPPQFLRYHIRQAVNIAGANRIGHGVDIPYENHAQALLNEMAKRHIMVEINLSSNASILGIKGKKHPLHLYLKNHVPVALSTDDQGILRTDLTGQYKIAILSQHLNYATLKQMDRNSLIYSFLPGNSIWQLNGNIVPACRLDVLGGQHLSNACQQLLDHSEKARLQWKLEHQFAVFEKTIASNNKLVIKQSSSAIK